MLTAIATVSACATEPATSNDPLPGGSVTLPPDQTGPDAPPGKSPTGAPIGLVATAVSPTQIDVCWRPVPEQGASYLLYRNGEVIATTAEPCHEDKGVAASTTYRYAVTAMSDGDESPKSEEAAATTFKPDQAGDVTMGGFRSYVTIHSIGVEWDVSGDSNRNATAAVSFRRAGSPVWRTAMPLMRVDFNGANMLAGSILFLDGGTEYDVVLSMTDPDGGSQTKRFQIKTRALPTLPTGGRTFHVVPGSGGGDGTEASPFKGVAAAAAVAKAGDVMLLHGGNYGGRISFTKGGEPGNPVAWKAAGDGEPVFAGIEVRASHMWIEGLRIEAGGGYDFPIGLRTAGSPTEVSVVHCTVVGNHYSIWLNGGGSNWYIADNTIVGISPLGGESFSGEGIELQHTAGHTVAHNRISRTADGVSYCDRNCDIFGNDIFDMTDDGTETDGGFANIRIWGNRLHNTGHNGVSFQPMSGAPWYVIRNQIIGNSESPLKTRGTDRFILAHNTMVNWTNVQTIWGQEMLNAYSRNNIWVSVKGGLVWNMGSNSANWKTNLDYDGFDWGGTSSPFKFGGSNFRDLLSFSKSSSQEQNGVTLSRSCFPTMNVPAAPPAPVPAQLLQLGDGCAAIDAGQVLPNINDGFVGAAPDLGAFESGAPALHFGPR